MNANGTEPAIERRVLPYRRRGLERRISERRQDELYVVVNRRGSVNRRGLAERRSPVPRRMRSTRRQAAGD